jgi:cytochrome P450/ferredoxin-NADP reductase
MNSPITSGCPFHKQPAEPKINPNGCPVSAGAAAFNPFEGAYQADPAGYLRWAREQEPVFWSPELNYWIVTKYEDVKAVFRDNITFSPSIALEKITPASPQVMKVLEGYGFAMNRTMVNEDEPDHMERRRLLTDSFLPENLVDYEPIIRSLAKEYINRFIHQGRADLVKEMFYEIPLNVALKFLGVPDDGAEQLRQFAVAHTINTWGKPTEEEQLIVAENVGKFWQTAQQILDGMKENPDGVGWMYETIRQHLKHPDIVTDSYLRSMMMAILAAAHETTSNATANAFMTLLSQREAWEKICENPALIPNAVEECLRVAGSIIAWRRIATVDTKVGDISIAKGSKLLIVQASANFDASHFENPEQVDLYRENAVEHLTFGYGAHQCMGKNIGRMQMRIFLEEFVKRLPHMYLAPKQEFDYLQNTSFRGPSELWVEWDPTKNPVVDGQTNELRNKDFYIGPPSKENISRTVVVQQIKVEGENLFKFELADPRSEDLPEWSAGAHIDLIAGGFRRKYSLCGDSSNRKHYEVVIQKEADGRGGSNYFCSNLKVGDKIQLSGPKNLFKLNESANRYVLVAGGIGITPMLAMADRLKALGKSYELHYAGSTRKRMALLERVERDHGKNLTLHISSENSRMNLNQITKDIRENDLIYVCGPGRLIDELVALSEQWPEGILHYEYFNVSNLELDPSKEHEFIALLKDSNVSVVVRADQTLLQALQAAGVDIPCDCGEGLCGTCEVNVIEGDIDHRDKVLSKSEKSDGKRMMTCCSRAIGQKIVLGL